MPPLRRGASTPVMVLMAFAILFFLAVFFSWGGSDDTEPSPPRHPKVDVNSKAVEKTVTMTVTKACQETALSSPAKENKRTDFMFMKLDSPLVDRTVRLSHPHEADKRKEPESRQYSKFRCSGNDNDIDGYVERVCVFENVCFDTDSKAFHFYQREDRPARPVLFESRLGEMTNFHHEDHGFVAVKQLFWAAVASEHDTFAPKIIRGKSPAAKPNSTVTLAPLHVLWSTWAQDDNLGHLLWEELAGIWYGMIRMNVLSENVTAMHWPDTLPDRKLAVKFRNAFFPAISSRPPVTLYDYAQELAKNGESHVCFDQLLVGGNVRRFLQRMAWHNYGQEPLFFSLRGRILQSMGLSPYHIPKAHKIVITHKTSSNYHHESNYKTHRSIYNIDEVTAFIKSKYPKVKVEVVEFKDMTVKEQLRLMTTTTVLITPAGGISMILPFLPDGAQAIILDYLEKEDSQLIGTRGGESVSMEAPFWNHWPHVKKLYYQIRSKEEMRSDDPTKSINEVSWRDEVSVSVNLERLEGLLEAAFEHMAS
ncbi:hypothetical protein HDU67_008494 [Dinochytrium kinnereticum]|nr:hypothetical protein HDU67_008494 [Dinochytrium kinnereticum]